MTDFEIVNRKTRRVVKTLKNVLNVTPIPNGCRRMWFRHGTCKISGSYDLRPLKER